MSSRKHPKRGKAKCIRYKNINGPRNKKLKQERHEKRCIKIKLRSEKNKKRDIEIVKYLDKIHGKRKSNIRILKEEIKNLKEPMTLNEYFNKVVLKTNN